MTEKKLEVKRVAGALAWPGSAPGAVVVLGQEYRTIFPEDQNITPETQILYHLLAFFESDDLSQLIEVARDLKWRKYGGAAFYARTNHKAGMNFLELFNAEAMKAGEPLFHLSEAPMTAREEHHRRGNIEAHLGLVREYTKPGRQRLMGFRGTKLPAHLNAIPRQVTKLMDLDHPSVSALAYALAALIPTEYSDREDRMAEALLEEVEREAGD